MTNESRKKDNKSFLIWFVKIREITSLLKFIFLPYISLINIKGNITSLIMYMLYLKTYE